MSIFTNRKLKSTASTAPLKHLTITVRQGRLSNSGHGRRITYPVLLVHQWFSGS